MLASFLEKKNQLGPTKEKNVFGDIVIGEALVLDRVGIRALARSSGSFGRSPCSPQS